MTAQEKNISNFYKRLLFYQSSIIKALQEMQLRSKDMYSAYSKLYFHLLKKQNNALKVYNGGDAFFLKLSLTMYTPAIVTAPPVATYMLRCSPKIIAPNKTAITGFT
jgi:hypothetical protein